MFQLGFEEYTHSRLLNTLNILKTTLVTHILIYTQVFRHFLPDDFSNLTTPVKKKSNVKSPSRRLQKDDDDLEDEEEEEETQVLRYVSSFSLVSLTSSHHVLTRHTHNPDFKSNLRPL